MRLPRAEDKKFTLEARLVVGFLLGFGAFSPAVAKTTPEQALALQVQGATLIVVGTQSAYAGKSVDTSEYVSLDLSVEEVIKGSWAGGVMAIYTQEKSREGSHRVFFLGGKQNQVLSSHPLENLPQIRALVASTVLVGENPPVVHKGRFVDLGFVWKSVKNQLIVASVRPSSAAAEARIKAEDVICLVEKNPVSTPQAFEDLMETFAAGSRVKIKIQRQDDTQDVFLTIPRKSSVGLTEEELKRPIEKWSKEDLRKKGWIPYGEDGK